MKSIVIAALLVLAGCSSDATDGGPESKPAPDLQPEAPGSVAPQMMKEGCYTYCDGHTVGSGCTAGHGGYYVHNPDC